MPCPDAMPRPHLTIALIEDATGWTFRLHREGRRVWADSLPTDAPVPVDYLTGGRTRALEAAASECGDDAVFLRALGATLRPGVAALTAVSISGEV